MVVWWESLDLASQILYCIAIPATLILLLQTLLTLIGWGHLEADVNPSDVSGLGLDVEMETDMGHPGDGAHVGDFSALRLFSLQGIVALLSVFGWASLILYHAFGSLLLAVPIGCVMGFLAMYGVAKLVWAARRLTSSGNISLKNALGVTGQVYIPIAPGQQGKVNLVVQERFIEADAISDATKNLPSGTVVRVMDVRAGVLVVEEEREDLES
ncbi:MAG: hypothetical protein FWG14_07780 [Peptococcaceae bacterium]|nr:hypothetical protein [Peptococcaceae bacterium]